MQSLSKPSRLVLLILCGVSSSVLASQPDETIGFRPNSYHLCTKDLQIDKLGVAAVPSRFKWSVETSFSGIDVQGNDLPDARIMLRLYDPDHTFTAITAQMTLATAQKLHRDLGHIITQKTEAPNFQYRPRLYSPEKIPTGKVIGFDKKGVAIIELTYPKSNRTEILNSPNTDKNDAETTSK